MADWDNEYFFVLKPKGDRSPFLVPDVNIEGKSFGFERQPFGSPPLVFTNGWRDENKKKGIFAEATDIVFSGSDLVVRSSIREKLLQLDIPGLVMEPAVFIDDTDNWHKDYWYLTFTDRFDCWDRESSEYDEDTPPMMVRGKPKYAVATYSLDRELMDKTPLQDRLLFKMGGASRRLSCVTRASRRSSVGGGESGARLVAVADY